jgi:transposase
VGRELARTDLAVENANGLGWLLSRQLLEADEQVRDVPAALSAQVRKLSGSGHKTDAHDARSTAVAGRHARRLRTVVPDGTPQVLGLLLERRARVVSTRQRVLVGIHEQLVKLVPGGVPRHLSAHKTAAALRKIRPTDPVGAMRRRVVVELLAELRSLDRKLKTCDAELGQALADYRTCLTGIDGIGPPRVQISLPSSAGAAATRAAQNHGFDHGDRVPAGAAAR